MALFTSKREKRLWVYVLLVLAAIIGNLIFGGALIRSMDQDLIQPLGFYAMLLLFLTFIINGFITRPGKEEITVWLGLTAVYILLYTRLGFAERSHIFEFGILAILIHKALCERIQQGQIIAVPGVIAFFVTFIIGVFDEFVQIFLPDRVFDINDIAVNGISAFVALAVSWVIIWLRKKIIKKS